MDITIVVMAAFCLGIQTTVIVTCMAQGEWKAVSAFLVIWGSVAGVLVWLVQRAMEAMA